ncbi:hypothetical protein JCM8097_009203 [Rhodosporidiobolus ruineniae]
MPSPRRAPSMALTALFLLACQATCLAASVFNCVGGTVYFIAHADDDLLFQSPDLYTDMAAGNCITTVIMTAGDSGTTGMTYLSARESGNQAGYANMAGKANTYTEVAAVFGGQTVTVRTLAGAPQVQKVFFRLPDGNMDGSGFPTTGYQSLRMLYFGSISSITNQPKTATFTLSTLKQALAEIMTARKPSFVRTLDYMSDYDSGDHADHLTVARLVAGLAPTYASNATIAGYMGYPVQNFPPTMAVTDSGFIGKQNAFFAYTPYDSAECQSYVSCVSAGRGESYWLQRQYIVNEYLAQQSYMGSAEAPVALPNGTNIARLADVTASSDWDTQPATAAIDGNIQGYPGNSSAEWSTYGETVGAWIQLTWDEPYNVSSIVLNDRPNLNDWMTGSTLTFADNSTVSVGALANDGSATLVNLGGTVVTDSIFLYVTSVSSATGQVGLAEFQVYGEACPGCTIGNNFVNATTTTTSAGTVAGSASSEDLALLATASSSSSAPSQGPEKAIDGVVSGYLESGKGNSSAEWASFGQGSGAWLALQWPQSYMIDSLVFHDRPNSADQITGGTVYWADGSTLAIPSLNNDGSATVVNLSTPVNTSSLFYWVTSVSSSTSSAGLAELEAYYSLPQTPLLNNTAASNNGSATTLPVQGDLDDETWADDLALLPGVEATASSLVDGQDPGNAINGDANGYVEDGSGDIYQEWATNGEGVGAWINLTWPYSIQISQISLFDRPNLADQVTSGKFTFDDGSFISVGALDNDGSATNFSVPGTVSTSILFTVTGVSSTTSSVGLSEFAVFGSVPSNSSSNSTLLDGSSLLDSTSSLLNSTSSLLNSTSSLLNSTSSLINGTAIYNGTSSLYNSTTGALINGTWSLVNGTSSLLNSTGGYLANGTASLYNGTSTFLNTTSGYLANGTSSLVNGTSSLLNSTGGYLANGTASLYNGTSSLVNSTASSLANGTSSLVNGTSSLLNSTGTALANGTSSLINGTSSALNTTTGSLANGTSSLLNSSSNALNGTVVGASSLLSGVLPSSTKNASSAAALPTGSLAFNLSSVLPSASASASASLSANASSAAVPTGSASFVNSTVGFTTSTRSASAAASTASSLASSASSVLSSASSVVSSQASSASSALSSQVFSAASVASSAASKASSAASSVVSSMVTSTRASSASSTAVSSSVVASSTSSAVATGLPTAAAQAATVDIARLPGCTATASSFISKSPPAGAIDGNIGGVSALGLGTASQEWVASGTTGQWWEINCDKQYLMRDLVLYGRVNTWQSVTSGALNFTDGTVIKVGSIASSGGSHVSLGDGITSSGVRLTVTGVSLTTTRAGLAEVQIYNRAPPTTGLVGTLGNAVGQTLGGVLGLLGLRE